MKRTDFKPCANCGKGVAHTGLPLFWVVEIQRFGIDAQAVQRQHGMEQFDVAQVHDGFLAISASVTLPAAAGPQPPVMPAAGLFIGRLRPPVGMLDSAS